VERSLIGLSAIAKRETLVVRATMPFVMNEDFEVIGRIEHIEPIAVGSSIREIHRLRKAFGQGSVAKAKGKGDR
jgi:hypothetical protein